MPELDPSEWRYGVGIVEEWLEDLDLVMESVDAWVLEEWIHLGSGRMRRRVLGERTGEVKISWILEMTWRCLPGNRMESRLELGLREWNW